MSVEATTATMTVISEALFSGDARLTSREAMDHITHAMEGVSEARLQVLLGLPLVPVSLRGLRGHRGMRFLRRTLGEIVRERLAPGAPQDFVTNVIRALMERFPEDEALELAVDNAATFYLAGHETTANTTSWTLYLLSEQPGLQEQAAAEAQAALASGAGADLPDRLPLLRAILEESLRLYPPVPRFDREAVAGDRLGEHDPARRSRLDLARGSSTATNSCGTSPMCSTRSASLLGARSNGTDSSTSPSAAVRGPASERGWRWPKR